MDTPLIELALLLSLVLPLVVVALCLLLYINWVAYTRAKLERKRINSQRTITRNHKRLFIIDSERD
jgi:hypothetical protein